MKALTRPRLEAILKKRLRLRSPKFALRKLGDMVSGYVISESFRGKNDLQRVRLLRDAVDAELGADSNRLVGTLLALTPLEWDGDPFTATSNGRRSKAG
jgi:hypothetical protein